MVVPRTPGALLVEVEAVLQEAMGRVRSLLERERVFFSSLIQALSQNIELRQADIAKIFERDWTDQDFKRTLSTREGRRHREQVLADEFIAAPEKFEFNALQKPQKIGF